MSGQFNCIRKTVELAFRPIAKLEQADPVYRKDEIQRLYYLMYIVVIDEVYLRHACSLRR